MYTVKCVKADVWYSLLKGSYAHTTSVGHMGWQLREVVGLLIWDLIYLQVRYPIYRCVGYDVGCVVRDNVLQAIEGELLC